MSVPRIKVCGITRVQDAALASDLGAWAVGFVFWPGSRRAVSPANARRIVDALAAPAVLPVGVFVDATLDEIHATVDAARLDAVQLHGAESASFCAKAKARLPGVSVFKALRTAPGEAVDAHDFAIACDAVLVDAAPPAKRANWEAAAALARTAPLILAGGLSAENVGRALAAVDPFALDVSRGVERSPGEKDHSRMRAFFDQAARRDGRP